MHEKEERRAADHYTPAPIPGCHFVGNSHRQGAVEAITDYDKVAGPGLQGKLFAVPFSPGARIRWAIFARRD